MSQTELELNIPKRQIEICKCTHLFTGKSIFCDYDREAAYYEQQGYEAVVFGYIGEALGKSDVIYRKNLIHFLDAPSNPYRCKSSCYYNCYFYSATDEQNLFIYNFQKHCWEKVLRHDEIKVLELYNEFKKRGIELEIFKEINSIKELKEKERRLVIEKVLEWANKKDQNSKCNIIKKLIPKKNKKEN